MSIKQVPMKFSGLFDVIALHVPAKVLNYFLTSFSNLITSKQN